MSLTRARKSLGQHFLVDRRVLGRILVAEGSEGVAVNTAIAVMLEEGEDVSVLEEIIRLKASEAEKTVNETNRQKLYAELPSVYARLREINNENLDYVVREGEAWWKAGNQDKALETWNEIISEEETEIRRHELLGATLLRQKRFDEGIAALRKGIELDTSRDDLRMQIGEVLLEVLVDIRVNGVMAAGVCARLSSVELLCGCEAEAFVGELPGR